MNTILVLSIAVIWIGHAEDSDVIDQCMQLRIRDADGKVKCVDCKRCPAGHASYPPCHENKTWDARKLKKGCKRCRHGMFQQFYGSTMGCRICNRCLPHYKVLKNCTIFNDVSCSDDCENGYYKLKAECLPCCECLSASDSKEPQCSGMKNKFQHCRSYGGKCKSVPVDPFSSELTTKTTVPPVMSSKATPVLKTSLFPSTMTSLSTKVLTTVRFLTSRTNYMTTTISKHSFVSKPSPDSSMPHLAVTSSKSIKYPPMTSSTEVKMPSPSPSPKIVTSKGKSSEKKSTHPAVFVSIIIGIILVGLSILIIAILCQRQGRCTNDAAGQFGPAVTYNHHSEGGAIRFHQLRQDSPLMQRDNARNPPAFEVPNSSGGPSHDTSAVNTTTDNGDVSRSSCPLLVDLPPEETKDSQEGDKNLRNDSENTEERNKQAEAVAASEPFKPENKASKIPSIKQILAQRSCIICEETKEGERSTTSIIAAREVVEVEHAVLHFDNLRRDLNSEDCDRIYRTLTGETCPFTGIKDTKSLLAGIQTEMPELTVGSYFKVLEVIGKKNVAIKIHDNFHNDREEILAVKKCIICGNTDKNEVSKPDRMLEKKLADVDDSKSFLNDLMEDFKPKDLLRIYRIFYGQEAEKGTDLKEEAIKSLSELNVANYFKFLQLIGKMEFAHKIHDSLHEVLTVDA